MNEQNLKQFVNAVNEKVAELNKLVLINRHIAAKINVEYSSHSENYPHNVKLERLRVRIYKEL